MLRANLTDRPAKDGLTVARDFDAEILATEQELAVSVEKLETIKEQFIGRTAEFLGKWAEDHVTKTVRERHDVTMGLGDQLSELKKDLRDLQGRAEVTVRETLDTDAPWWHRSFKPNTLYYVSDKHGSDVLDGPIRQALGAVATLLVKYGYIRASAGTVGGYGWAYGSGRNFRWTGHGLQWSDDMCALMEPYATEQRKGEGHQAAIDRLRREKAQARAADLWESA
jgi:hypothetical protein